MYDIDSLRQNEFPISRDYIYFNHAAISPLPTRTKNKMQWVVEHLALQPANFWIDAGMKMAEDLKAEVAAFVNATSPQEVVPISTTSFGLNILAQAIAWEPGDNIIFCDVEFPSNAYPWMSLARDGVAVRCVPADEAGGLTLEALTTAADGRTRLVAASAVQFFTGHRTDLAAIGAYCRERGILFVVDAIQAIGHMPFDMQAMNIDVLATGGQKSIMAAPGVGFMVVRDAVAETLRPRLIGGNATQDFLHWLAYDLTPLPGAQRFNMGTPNLPGLFGLLESLRLLRELEVGHIDRHTSGLVDEAITLLTARGYEVITPRAAHGPIVTFKSGLNDAMTNELVNYLKERNVSVVKHLDRAGAAYVRLSFHCYNTSEELIRFMAILDEWNDLENRPT